MMHEDACREETINTQCIVHFCLTLQLSTSHSSLRIDLMREMTMGEDNFRHINIVNANPALDKMLVGRYVQMHEIKFLKQE